MMWIGKAIKSIWYSLLAFPVAPIIAFLSLQGEVLPEWAWPFLTHDNSIDGDDGHLKRWPDNGTKWRVFCRRTAWLWRNRAYNYRYNVTGINTLEDVKVIRGRVFWYDVNPKGYCYAKCGNAWMLFAWYPYNFLGFKAGLRIYLGWKLRNKLDDTSSKRAMLVTHINPFKGVM